MADPALDTDEIHSLVEGRVRGRSGSRDFNPLWAWRERPVQVKGPATFFADNLVQVPATGAVFASAASAVYRVDSGAAILVHPPTTNPGARLWADANAIWNVDGQNVLRDGRLVFTLPERRAISVALFDREGSLWLGTDAGGLHRLKPALFTTYSLPEGVGHPNVYSTYVDHSGAIWLGTWGKGVSRIDPVTGRIRVLESATIPSSVNSFYEDKAGKLWIAAGAGYGGLFVCSPPVLRCSGEGPEELRERAVFALYGDADNLSDRRGWLFRYDGRTWVSFSVVERRKQPCALWSTRDGALWMGTNGGGLARYRDGSFSRVTRADGLPSDLVRSLCKTRRLALGRYGGPRFSDSIRAWGEDDPSRRLPSSDRHKGWTLR
jgi:hypothetical protein